MKNKIVTAVLVIVVLIMIAAVFYFATHVMGGGQ